MDHPGTDERRLIRAAQAGDDMSFGELFARYRTPLYRLCLQRTADSAFAEDVVQDAFARARERIASFDPNRPLFPWLASIALHRATDLWRKDSRLVPFGLSFDRPAATADATWQHVEAGVDRDRLRVAMDMLSRKQRRALLLHDLHGLPYAEIASIESSSDVAVRSLVCRARAIMRSALGTLGWLGLAWRHKMGHLRQRLAPLANAADGFAAISVLTVGAAVIAAVLVAGEPLRPKPAIHPDSMRRSTMQPSHLVQRVGGEPRWLPAATVFGSAPKVRLHPRVGGPRPGSVAPSGGQLTIEVDGVDGRPVWQHSTWVDCAGVGSLPSPGPIHTTC